MKLSFENIHYSYSRYEPEALGGVSLEFRPGERVGLLGRNGCGKTTLMLHANGIIRPLKGEIRLDEKPVHYTRKGLLDLRRRVGLVFQNPEEQLFSANVMQDLSLGPLNLGMTEAETRRRIIEVAELCELTSLLDRPTHALSGGEKTRVALAGVLAIDPLYLFADEITNSLDPWMRRQILGILDRWVDGGHTVVLATHDWRLVRNWTQRVIWLDRGSVFRQGPTESVLNGTRFPMEDI